jgi:hypothetical protein
MEDRKGARVANIEGGVKVRVKVKVKGRDLVARQRQGGRE